MPVSRRDRGEARAGRRRGFNRGVRNGAVAVREQAQPHAIGGQEERPDSRGSA